MFTELLLRRRRIVFIVHTVLAGVVATTCFDVTLGYPGEGPSTRGVNTWDKAATDNHIVEALKRTSLAVGRAGDSWAQPGTVMIGHNIHILECGDLENPSVHHQQQNCLRDALGDTIRASLPDAQATDANDTLVNANVLLGQRTQECGITLQVVMPAAGTILVDLRISVPGE